MMNIIIIIIIIIIILLSNVVELLENKYTNYIFDSMADGNQCNAVILLQTFLPSAVFILPYR